MNLTELNRNIKNTGLAGAAGDLAYRAINRITPFMILRVVELTLKMVDRQYLSDKNGYRQLFLSEPALRGYADDPALEMSHDFLDKTLAKGDRCFAILDGDVLASYGWYSNKETQITNELTFRYQSEWIYMYKGFTHPAYRGKRLHAIGMAMALKAFSEDGRRGIVSYVEANNFNSLKSVYRMGYVDIGSVIVCKIFGKYRIHVDKACESFDIDVLPV